MTLALHAKCVPLGSTRKILVVGYGVIRRKQGWLYIKYPAYNLMSAPLHSPAILSSASMIEISNC